MLTKHFITDIIHASAIMIKRNDRKIIL